MAYCGTFSHENIYEPLDILVTEQVHPEKCLKVYKMYIYTHEDGKQSMVFPNRPLRYKLHSNMISVGVVKKEFYFIPQPKLVHWGGQSGFLLYTQADSGLLGWSARVSNVYPSQIWFVGVVSQGSYCIPF